MGYAHLSKACESCFPTSKGRGAHNIIQLHGCVPLYIVGYIMGLHYLIFMERNLENKIK